MVRTVRRAACTCVVAPKKIVVSFLSSRHPSFVLVCRGLLFCLRLFGVVWSTVGTVAKFTVATSLGYKSSTSVQYSIYPN